MKPNKAFTEEAATPEREPGTFTIFSPNQRMQLTGPAFSPSEV